MISGLSSALRRDSYACVRRTASTTADTGLNQVLQDLCGFCAEKLPILGSLRGMNRFNPAGVRLRVESRCRVRVLSVGKTSSAAALLKSQQDATISQIISHAGSIPELLKPNDNVPLSAQ